MYSSALNELHSFSSKRINSLGSFLLDFNLLLSWWQIRDQGIKLPGLNSLTLLAAILSLYTILSLTIPSIHFISYEPRTHTQRNSLLVFAVVPLNKDEMDDTNDDDEDTQSGTLTWLSLRPAAVRLYTTFLKQTNQRHDIMDYLNIGQTLFKHFHHYTHRIHSTKFIPRSLSQCAQVFLPQTLKAMRYPLLHYNTSLYSRSVVAFSASTTFYLDAYIASSPINW